ALPAVCKAATRRSSLRQGRDIRAWSVVRTADCATEGHVAGVDAPGMWCRSGEHGNNSLGYRDQRGANLRLQGCGTYAVQIAQGLENDAFVSVVFGDGKPVGF